MRNKLLRDRPDFRRLWLSGVASGIGDWLSYIAVSVLVLQRGESALALALVFALHTLPHALLAPLTGPLADRYERGTLMRWSLRLRGLLTLAMAGAAMLGALGWLQGLLLLRVALATVHQPAARAALARVVEPAELAAANAFDALTWSVLFALGVVLGGALSAWLGPVPALLADAVTFFVAASLLRGLPALHPAAGARRLGRLREAWRYAAGRPPLLRAVLGRTPVSIATGGGWVTLNLLAFGAAGASGVGAAHLGRALGTAIGPAVHRRAGRAGPGMDVLAFLGVAALAGSGSIPALFCAALVWGMGSGAAWVWTQTRMQREAPDRLLGRTSALDGLLSTLGMGCGALLGALLVDLTTVPGHAATLGATVGLLAWVGVRGAVAAVARGPGGARRGRGIQVSGGVGSR